MLKFIEKVLMVVAMQSCFVTDAACQRYVEVTFDTVKANTFIYFPSDSLPHQARSHPFYTFHEINALHFKNYDSYEFHSGFRPHVTLHNPAGGTMGSIIDERELSFNRTGLRCRGCASVDAELSFVSRPGIIQCHYIKLKEPFKYFSFNVSGDGAIIGGLKDVYIYNDTLKLLFARSDSKLDIEVDRCKFDYFGVAAGDSLKMYMDNVEVRNLSIAGKYCELDIDSSPLPDSIFIQNSGTENGSIDLSSFQRQANKECILMIASNNLKSLVFDYSDFQIVFWDVTENLTLTEPSDDPPPAKLTIAQKRKMYSTLLTMQKEHGFIEGYEKLDKEIKEFEYTINASLLRPWGFIANSLDRWWWDYGYDRRKVIDNSLFLFILFILLNYAFFRQLREVYPIPRIELLCKRIGRDRVANIVRYYYKLFFAVAFYTSYVFWGLKMNIHDLELRRPGILFLLISQYIIGLVCLAYIANYIITT